MLGTTTVHFINLLIRGNFNFNSIVHSLTQPPLHISSCFAKPNFEIKPKDAQFVLL